MEKIDFKMRHTFGESQLSIMPEHYTFPGRLCCGQTLWLIRPMHNL
jgi:hypothetical protein